VIVNDPVASPLFVAVAVQAVAEEARLSVTVALSVATVDVSV
jgi:hypothetical protein